MKSLQAIIEQAWEARDKITLNQGAHPQGLCDSTRHA
jgi:hypothetical protein